MEFKKIIDEQEYEFRVKPGVILVNICYWETICGDPWYRIKAISKYDRISKTLSFDVGGSIEMHLGIIETIKELENNQWPNKN